ncbi:MAG: hypothetical protein M3357_03780 [Actinomycetota bacterium]|nr:hypothetical protein [Actinomycetota bacterium]
MPRPGSHKYDVKRARIRNALDDSGVPDKQADKLANEILQGEPGAKGRLPGNSRVLRFLQNRRRARKAGAGG